jgi:ubiquinone/menaquinone biosynthesis C-methylase UbiE
MPLTPAAELDIEAALQREEERERERQVLPLLDRHGLLPLSGKKILDVGCGTGKWLRDLIGWGADTENLFGVELLQASAARARRLCPPSVTIEWGNAADLRFPSGSFDIVLQSMVFTSVLDPQMRQTMAAEMLRVLRPEGIILWYDLCFGNIRSSYVQPVSRAEIRQLFPDCIVELRRVRLAPSLTRLVAPRSPAAYSILSRIPPLCTHYLGAVRRPSITR